ncbi:hypothetical protein QBC47DRAFT_65140 [Echria macrotheca]|uniref:Uncharacterized protein n=1 Tax=Echria macrotheca TaxID=438768 RepID=A0AAJ0B5I8_9PEZI|nr:hypothetical protein QBC47DRAFT_65140 [Echria macrotheca]
MNTPSASPLHPCQRTNLITWLAAASGSSQSPSERKSRGVNRARRGVQEQRRTTGQQTSRGGWDGTLFSPAKRKLTVSSSDREQVEPSLSHWRSTMQLWLPIPSILERSPASYRAAGSVSQSQEVSHHSRPRGRGRRSLTGVLVHDGSFVLESLRASKNLDGCLHRGITPSTAEHMHDLHMFPEKPSFHHSLRPQVRIPSSGNREDMG